MASRLHPICKTLPPGKCCNGESEVINVPLSFLVVGNKPTYSIQVKSKIAGPEAAPLGRKQKKCSILTDDQVYIYIVIDVRGWFTYVPQHVRQVFVACTFSFPSSLILFLTPFCRDKVFGSCFTGIQCAVASCIAHTCSNHCIKKFEPQSYRQIFVTQYPSIY